MAIAYGKTWEQLKQNWCCCMSLSKVGRVMGQARSCFWQIVSLMEELDVHDRDAAAKLLEEALNLGQYKLRDDRQDQLLQMAIEWRKEMELLAGGSSKNLARMEILEAAIGALDQKVDAKMEEMRETWRIDRMNSKK